MRQIFQEWTKRILWKTAFKNFKGCPPQNLLSPLLNTLSQIIVEYNEGKVYRKLEYLLKIVSIFTLEIPGF